MDYGNEIFSRAELLLGDDGMKRLEDVKVIVFGVGGVGSWCAESLVRTGVKHLTIVDSDLVAVSNINRQLMATTDTVGEVKVDALRRHLLSISPSADIIALQKTFDEESAESFHLEKYDYVVDCIDSLKDKTHLILLATSLGKKFYSSMGAALKLDPTRIRVAEFWDVKGCPLARALRQRFKKTKTFPKRKFKCVYSDELLDNKSVSTETDLRKARINGSLMHITAIFGLTLAGLIIKDLVAATPPQEMG